MTCTSLARKLVLPLVLAACSSPPPTFSARGVEHLSASAEPNTVELFFIEPLNRTQCDGCVIVEVIEGRERSAYFVHPNPSCGLLRAHSNGTRGGYDKDGTYVVGVTLNLKGVKELARCLQNSSSEHGSSQFLVVVEGQVVGTTFVSDRDPEFSLLFFHGTGLLEAVDRALSVPLVEQEKI
jgi:hypothetical protein